MRSGHRALCHHCTHLGSGAEVVLLEGALSSHLHVGGMVYVWMREEVGLPSFELICLLAISSSTLLQGLRMDLLLIQGGTLALKEDFHACQAVHTQICYQEGPEGMTGKDRGTQGGHW